MMNEGNMVMEVYLVYHGEQYEFNEVIGVFSDYVKARAFELAYAQKNNLNEDYGWTEIRKVEVNKEYEFLELGEEV